MIGTRFVSRASGRRDRKASRASIGFRPEVEGCEARALLSGTTVAILAAPVDGGGAAGSTDHLQKQVDAGRIAPVQFHAQITQGPHAGAKIQGILMLNNPGANGRFTGTLTQLGPIGGGLADQATIPVDGRIVGHRVALNFHLSDGTNVRGAGSLTFGRDGQRHLTFDGTGSLKTSTPGDSGDWDICQVGQICIDLSGFPVATAAATAKILIRNPTGSTINYQLGFNGSSSLKNYTLAPNTQTTFSLATTRGASLSPLIRFDKSYAAGFQEKVYSLSFVYNTIGTLTGPGIYRFSLSGPDNINLYST